MTRAVKSLSVRTSAVTIVALMLLNDAGTVALAQAPAAIPGTTREEIERPQQTPRPGPIDGDAVPTEEPQQEEVIDPNTELSFQLNAVDLRGATVYEPSDFDDILEDFIGTEISLGGLREIGNRIERRYRDDGFVATRVIVPPQAIREGVPTLQIFEGKIIHYEVNGEIGDVKKQIARLLDNLLTDKPARWTELERYLLLARDLPGISLTGTLRSAGDSAPGGVILVVDAARKPIDGFASLQNRNADPVGPFTLTAGLSANSNTEYGEKLGAVMLLAIPPIRQTTAFVTYEQSLGDEGLRLKASLTHGYSTPQGELRPLDLTTVSTIAKAELEFPVFRTRKFSLWTRGGFEAADQQTNIQTTQFFDDQVRALFLGVNGVWFPPLGGLAQLDIEFRQGLQDFGAPERFSAGQGRSRPDAVPDYTLVRGQVSHAQPFLDFFEVYLEARGQFSPKPLPIIEEMSLGELTVGRGYEPGSLTGESGFAGKFELRFTPPEVESWWLDNLQVYGFLDYGRIYDLGNPTNNPDRFEELVSAGFGVRFQVFKTIFGDVYLAMPQQQVPAEAGTRPKPSVRFSLTTFF